MRYRQFLWTILFFLFVISIPARAVDVTLDTLSNELSTGDTLEVKVVVDPQNINIAGVQLDLYFDSNKLQYIPSVKEGNLLKQNGANTFFAVTSPEGNSISNIIGVILENSSVSNKDIFITVTFKAINPGNALLELKNVKISEPTGNVMNVQVSKKRLHIVQVDKKNGKRVIGSISSGGSGGGDSISNEDYSNIKIREKYDLFIYRYLTNIFFLQRVL
jgi:hypothetical protein